jgi:ferritin-like metal-binding protein YciE
MLEEALLRDQFEAILDQERQVARAYADLLGKVDDPAVREQVEELLREKERHVELAERLLEIVE